MENAEAESWRQLVVWQKAHAAALQIYQVTKTFPPDERFRITDQICRAAVSIPTNIAEGKGRNTGRDFAQFLVIARGSTEETRYLLLLAKDLGFLPAASYLTLEANYIEVSKMLNALLHRLRR